MTDELLRAIDTGPRSSRWHDGSGPPGWSFHLWISALLRCGVDR